jgi:hypothetical protein
LIRRKVSLVAFLFVILLVAPPLRAQRAQIEEPRIPNSINVSSIFFSIVFGGALAGIALRRCLPGDHLGPDAKDVVKLATGMVVTMSGLVLGMLVSSAKSSYETRKTEVALMASQVIGLERSLAQYGPETREIRDELRVQIESEVHHIWPSQVSQKSILQPSDAGIQLFAKLHVLTPKSDSEAASKAEALSIAESLRHTRWLLFFESEQSTVPLPLLAVLLAWLTSVFLSFGLLAQPNPTVVVALLVSALAVSAAIFLMMEMYTPFSGLLQISPSPILEALRQADR